ncbi:PASTA domain-containing protein [Streptomyces arboris]|uniref:PASTA domain-containing protein n=1 Tax=Streptomyces arboris TaxID=2600619 RepID=UPI00178C533E|nr:PASTA domain-containing protein [Streptomyces arboris]
MVRNPRRLAPSVLVGVLALAGCSGGGTQTDDATPATAPATVESSTATASPPSATATAPAPTPDAVMPALHSRTYEQARTEFSRQDLSPARLTAAAQHKDVTLPGDHDDWYICDTSPRPGAPLPATTTVTVRLAQDFSDCTTSFNGYLYEENDPASTP